MPTDARLGLSIVGIPPEHIDQMTNDINAVEGLGAHIMPSWHSGMNIDVFPQGANKLNTVLRLLEMNNIKPEEAIVVGDSTNDLPLFEVGAYRVAMGNAIPELKSLADYIAPSIEEDGAAHVVEKFILGTIE